MVKCQTKQLKYWETIEIDVYSLFSSNTDLLEFCANNIITPQVNDYHLWCSVHDDPLDQALKLTPLHAAGTMPKGVETISQIEVKVPQTAAWATSPEHN